MYYAFNPIYYTATSSNASVSVKLKAGGKTIEFKAAVYNGSAKIYLSPFFQRLFSNQQQINIALYIDNQLKQTYTAVVYGYLPPLYEHRTSKLKVRWNTYYTEDQQEFSYILNNAFTTSVTRVNEYKRDGLLVKWRDNLSQKFAFTFSKGTETTKTTDQDTTEFDSGGFFYEKTREKKIEREIKCCAENLTDDEFWYVKTIVSSVFVSTYDMVEDEWRDILVKPGSFSHSEKDNLHNVELVFKMPVEKSITR